MRRGRHLMDALSEKLDIPREALPHGFALTLSGQRELTLLGCRHILTYSEEEILLSMGRRTLRVGGRGLLCASFAAGALTVTGEIDTLSFLG